MLRLHKKKGASPRWPAPVTRKEGRDMTTVSEVPVTQGELAPGSHSGVFYFRYSDRSPEWHRLRMTGIGGSEIGAICGLSKWTSAYKLWALKTKRIKQPEIVSEAIEWGNRLEPVIIDKFEAEHPDWVILRDPGTYHHNERKWQRANPDGLIFDGKEWAILEVKTAHFEDEWRNGPPPSYEAQVQWYMSVLGYSKAYFATLFHGNTYKEYVVEASPFSQEMFLERAKDFITLVEEDIEPDFDGAKSTYETVRELNPNVEDGEVELGDLGMHYFNAKTEASEASDREREMASRVLAAMGKAKRGIIHGDWMLSRQARGKGNPYLVQKRS